MAQEIGLRRVDLDEHQIGQVMIDALQGLFRFEELTLRNAVAELRERISVFSCAIFSDLCPLDEGAEARVYLNKRRRVVYKIISVHEGRAGYGFIPGVIRLDTNNEVRVDIAGKLSVLEFLRKIHRANQHEGVVYTKWAGISEDGDLIFEQPYICKGVKRPSMFREMLRDRELIVIAHRKETAAIGKAGEAWVLFDDLHEQNILARDGEAYVIDTLNRELTDADWIVLAEKGIKADKIP